MTRQPTYDAEVGSDMLLDTVRSYGEFSADSVALAEGQKIKALGRACIFRWR